MGSTQVILGTIGWVLLVVVLTVGVVLRLVTRVRAAGDEQAHRSKEGPAGVGQPPADWWNQLSALRGTFEQLQTEVRGNLARAEAEYGKARSAEERTRVALSRGRARETEDDDYQETPEVSEQIRANMAAMSDARQLSIEGTPEPVATAPLNALERRRNAMRSRAG